MITIEQEKHPHRHAQKNDENGKILHTHESIGWSERRERERGGKERGGGGNHLLVFSTSSDKHFTSGATAGLRVSYSEGEWKAALPIAKQANFLTALSGSEAQEITSPSISCSKRNS